MKLTKTKARVLVFLSQSSQYNHFVAEMSRKLVIDYAYLLNILGQMKNTGWVERYRLENKVFYKLTSTSPIGRAKEMLAKGQTNEVNEKWN